MRRWQKALAGVGATMVVLTAASYGYYRYRMAGMMKLVDELPAFSEPAAGARAPVSRGLGFDVGLLKADTVKATLEAKQLDCPDTSIRALMQQAREAKRQEVETAKAKGLDSVTGASMLYRRSPKERNPQVRLSCSDVPADVLTDRRRARSRGRLLFVFDSPQHPLRHVSYARSFHGIDDGLALAEFEAAKQAMTSLYGDPASGPAGAITLPLPLYQARTFTWKFADLLVSVKLMNMGEGRLSLDETVEVPWPVRADAPARRETVAAKTP